MVHMTSTMTFSIFIFTSRNDRNVVGISIGERNHQTIFSEFQPCDLASDVAFISEFVVTPRRINLATGMLRKQGDFQPGKKVRPTEAWGHR